MISDFPKTKKVLEKEVCLFIYLMETIFVSDVREDLLA